jgi:hypothetical protein
MTRGQVWGSRKRQLTRSTPPHRRLIHANILGLLWLWIWWRLLLRRRQARSRRAIGRMITRQIWRITGRRHRHMMRTRMRSVRMLSISRKLWWVAIIWNRRRL